MTKTTLAAGEERVLNVLSDAPDIRDRAYEPALIALARDVKPPANRVVLDQGVEGACTGFGLAAVIDQLLRRQQRAEQRVSARMLYEMAKLHDEWPGSEYEGSSCRGAVRGWKNMGVCDDASWPYVSPANQVPEGLTVDRAIEARRITVGAYYRLRAEVVDYHAEINEVGALYCSAAVHAGWQAPVVRGRGTDHIAIIEPCATSIGGHAFAIVGYNAEGFWVQNSWGKSWGVNGVALWLYEDWLEYVSDGWVVQLALPTPQIFGNLAGVRRAPTGEVRQGDERDKIFSRPAPKRLEIAGHFVHFDDGRFKARGNYWSTLDDVKNSADRLADSSSYDKLLVYAHGGLNDPKASARRVRSLGDAFKRNRIYPFHIMYDTGLAEEINDLVLRGKRASEGRSGGFSDWTDSLVETAARKLGTAIWGEMKRDAELPFRPGGDGLSAIAEFASRLAGTNKEIHLAGHSTGAIVLGHLLSGLEAMGLAVRIKTLTLFAPACRIDFFRATYQRFLDGRAAHVSVDQLVVYNLTDELERDDQVALVYRKSLLYLVSRAFERDTDVRLLGLEKYTKRLRGVPKTKFVYANGGSSRSSKSETHGGFDNDLATMNHRLRRIVGRGPIEEFTEDEMRAY
jgi:hypothetical protein